MEELRETLSCIFSDKIRKVVLSNQKNQDFLYRKIILERRENFYQVEKLTEEQAFHENLELNRAADYSEKLLKEGFGQLNAWGETREYAVKISKKGKILFQKRELEVPVKIRPEHNRRKRYLLEEGVIIPPLIDMGVFTKEGKVVRTMYDKFRQINKFVEFIDDAVDKSGLDKLRIIDFGCGK